MLVASLRGRMRSDLGVAVDLVTPDVVAQLKKGGVRDARVVSLDVRLREGDPRKKRASRPRPISRRRTLEVPVARASRSIARVERRPSRTRVTDVHLPHAPVPGNVSPVVAAVRPPAKKPPIFSLHLPRRRLHRAFAHDESL